MEQHIRFCTTSDAVRIAYATLGEGPPLLWVPGWLSHLELDFEFPPFKERLKGLAQDFTLTRFDKRGTGLSERGITDFSLDAHVLDIEAVVAACKLERFALAGYSEGGISIAYTARHLDAVSHLILMATTAAGARFAGGPEMQAAIISVIKNEWGLGSRLLSDLFFGEGVDPAVHQGFALYQQQAATAIDVVRSTESFLRWDLTPLLPSISTPTLVLHARNDRAAPIEGGQEIAAGISGARFVSVDGHHVPDRKQMAQMDDAIREFILGTTPRREQTTAPATLPSGMTAILFADIADSTALTERLGDGAFRAKARDLDASLRTVIRDHSGTAIDGKLLGDGVLAVFTSARQAIEAALACSRSGDDAGLPLHLGLHAGDVIREDNNIYGGAVNIASRISGLSAPGEVLVSDIVRGLARTSAGVGFEDRGEQPLKGVSEAVRVWAVVKSG